MKSVEVQRREQTRRVLQEVLSRDSIRGLGWGLGSGEGWSFGPREGDVGWMVMDGGSLMN